MASPTRPSEFIISVFSQPVSSFQKWKGRGVTTLFRAEAESGAPHPVSLEEWAEAARKDGFQTIRARSKFAGYDAGDPALLAFLQDPDEPDKKQAPPGPLSDEYNACKSSLPWVPVVMTFSGGVLTSAQGPEKKAGQATDPPKLDAVATPPFYDPYLQACDWVSADLYPVTGWNLNIPLTQVGSMVQAGAYLSGGKPQIAILECSDQCLGWVPDHRAATAAEFRAMVWVSVIAGASGVCYFPQQIGGFLYDATPDPLVRAMTKMNARLYALRKVLVSPSKLLTLPAPFLGCEKIYEGKVWRGVTNASPLPSRLAGQTFMPWETIEGFCVGPLMSAASSPPPMAPATVRT